MDQPISTSPTPLSTLRERPNLGRLLAQVTAAFGRAQPVAFSGPDVVAARLDTLWGPLRAYFEEIEKSGILGRIQERAPHQGELFGHLRREHGSVLQQLDRLRSAGAIERRSGWWSSEVQALIEHVTHLVTREAKLLAEATESGT